MVRMVSMILLGLLTVAASVAAQSSVRVVTVLIYQSCGVPVEFPSTLDYPTNPASYSQMSTRPAGPSNTTATQYFSPGYLTSIQPYTGTLPLTAPTTITTILPSGTRSGIYIIQYPRTGWVTVTSAYIGTAALTGQTTVRTVSPSGGYPGTYYVETPAPSSTYSTSNVVGSYTSNGITYSTTFEITTAVSDAGPTPAISTQINPSISEPFTTTISSTPVVQIPPYTTIYTQFPSASSITAPVTVTTIPPNSAGNGQGTIIVGVPAVRWVTTTVRWTGSTLITAPITSSYPPTGTEPGSVVVQTPPPVVSTTRAYSGTSSIPSLITATTLVGSGSDAWTVILETLSGYQPPLYQTTTQLYTGASPISDPITTTFEPSGTNAGLVLIQTPPGWVTSTRAYSGSSSITAPITATSIWPVADSPGVVWIETPTGYAQPSTSEPVQSSAQLISSTGSALSSPTPAGSSPVQSSSLSTQGGLSQVPSSSLSTQGGLSQVPMFSQPSASSTAGQSISSTLGSISTPSSSPSALPTCPPLVCGAIARNSTSCENSYGNPYNVTCGIRLWGTIAKRATVRNSEECLVQCDQTPGCVAVNFYSQASPQPENCELLSEVDYETSDPGTAGAERPADVEEINSVPPTSSAESTPPPQQLTTTTTRLYTGTSPISDFITATTIPASGSNPAVVVIESPGPPGSPGYQTSFRPYTGTSFLTVATTISTVLPSDQVSGTYIVETPSAALPSSNFASSSPAGSSPAASTSTLLGSSNSGIALATSSDVSSSGALLPSVTGFSSSAASLPGASSSSTSGAILPSVFGPSSSAAVSSSASGISTSAALLPSIFSSSLYAAPSLPSTNSISGSETYVTVTRPWTGTSPIFSPTIVSTILPSNGQPGTYIQETPASLLGHVTSTRGVYTGQEQITAATTVSTVFPSQGASGPVSGTYIVETPSPFISGASSTTAPSSSGQESYVTLTIAYSGSSSLTAPLTSTIAQPSAGNPGTVQIQTPARYVTSTRAYTGTIPITAATIVTTIQGMGSDPNTIVVEEPSPSGASSCAPNSNGNVTSANGNSYTVRCQAETDGSSLGSRQATIGFNDCFDFCDTTSGCLTFTFIGSGLIIEEGPGECQLKGAAASDPTFTSFNVNAVSAVRSGGVSPGPSYYVTTMRPGTNPGLIVIEYPTSSSQALTASATSAEASSTSASSSGLSSTSVPSSSSSQLSSTTEASTASATSAETSGTVVSSSQAPPPGYVTSTSYGPFAGTTTLTSIPYSGTISGTIILGIPETSQANYYITSTSYGSFPATTVLTSVAPSGTHPGSIWVGIPEIPTPGYQTSTSWGPFSSPTTLTSIAPNGQQSGTIIVGQPWTDTTVRILHLFTRKLY
ncbi:hypothetical protein M409DRAFT_23232 [Zasmidium cellare ATCC 36951]|uniref:Apple domain-containing protein n=1 Tax=Zasmidium cellare ATCC 36951 TaxID=1080233 RepID=A0A6A6CK69_ZASCE|nr:uncharacterized protein M409DRAFT_23232 [Zasmidium cellare ATCC 36951]KAF2166598.1 hypothetical protein M409DRAFT_23232 [Zasmidium cellare ATCC 36951]